MIRREERGDFSEFCISESERLDALVRELAWGDSVSENYVAQSALLLDAIVSLSEEYVRISHGQSLGYVARGIAGDAARIKDRLLSIENCCIKLGNSRAELDSYLRGAVGLTVGTDAKLSSVGDRIGNECKYIVFALALAEELEELSKLTLGFELCQDLIPPLEELIDSAEAWVEELEYAGRRLGCLR